MNRAQKCASARVDLLVKTVQSTYVPERSSHQMGSPSFALDMVPAMTLMAAASVSLVGWGLVVVRR